MRSSGKHKSSKIMAGRSYQQKQLLTLIRDFAAEKSQEERRVGNHKKQIQELQSELDAVYLELEEAKRLKESIEQELKGYEVELAVNDASIQTLEVRISSIQDEVSTVGSDLEALKNEEVAMRDNFIGKMFELNAKIRKFQQTIASAFHEANNTGMSVDETDSIHANSEDAEEARRALENKLSQIISQINKEEQEYQSEQDIHMQVQQELKDLEKKVSLMEAIVTETKELQELTRQTSELEEVCASIGDELQKKCICPSCHRDNVEVLGGIFQINDGS